MKDSVFRTAVRKKHRPRRVDVLAGFLSSQPAGKKKRSRLPAARAKSSHQSLYLFSTLPPQMRAAAPTTDRAAPRAARSSFARCAAAPAPRPAGRPAPRQSAVSRDLARACTCEGGRGASQRVGREVPPDPPAFAPRPLASSLRRASARPTPAHVPRTHTARPPRRRLRARRPHPGHRVRVGRPGHGQGEEEGEGWLVGGG